MIKMMRRTNARSSSGVILMSLRVTKELRCENRRIIKLNHPLFDIVVLQVFNFHFRDEFLCEIIQFNRHDP